MPGSRSRAEMTGETIHTVLKQAGDRDKVRVFVKKEMGSFLKDQSI